MVAAWGPNSMVIQEDGMKTESKIKHDQGTRPYVDIDSTLVFKLKFDRSKGGNEHEDAISGTGFSCYFHDVGLWRLGLGAGETEIREL